MDSVLKYRLQSWLFWSTGILFLFLVLLLLFVALMSFASEGWHFLDGLVLIGLVLFSATSATLIGIAYCKPVGLRVDADGISGYLAPVLAWEEIRRISPYRIHRGTCIGIELVDGDAFLEKQGAWGRLRHRLQSPFDVVINTSHCRQDAFAIAEQMQRFLKA